MRRAVVATKTGRIGVLGTEATIASRAYQDSFAAARDTVITAVACPRFVDFVERGVTSGRQIPASHRDTLNRCSRPTSTPWYSAAPTIRCCQGSSRWRWVIR